MPPKPRPDLKYAYVCGFGFGVIWPASWLITSIGENWELNNSRTPNDEPVNVKVAWHVVHNSDGLGNIATSQIENAVEQLNYYYKSF